MQCLIFLDDPQAVSDILEKLVKEDNLLMAYQICFDLYESASQQFLSSVIQNLRTVGTPIPSVPGSTNTGTVPAADRDRWAGDFKIKSYRVIEYRVCDRNTLNGSRLIDFVFQCLNGLQKYMIQLYFLSIALFI